MTIELEIIEFSFLSFDSIELYSQHIALFQLLYYLSYFNHFKFIQMLVAKN